jgi:hypothetical protein
MPSLVLTTKPKIREYHAVLWIRIRIKLKGRIRIRINVITDKLYPDPHQFTVYRWNAKMHRKWAYLSFFKRFWAFIWELGAGSASKWNVGIGSGSALKWQAGSGSASTWCRSAKNWHHVLHYVNKCQKFAMFGNTMDNKYLRLFSSEICDFIFDILFASDLEAWRTTAPQHSCWNKSFWPPLIRSGMGNIFQKFLARKSFTLFFIFYFLFKQMGLLNAPHNLPFYPWEEYINFL